MPTLTDLAKELGIDPATLKPEAVSKWNGYLSEAETKYTQATQAQRQAEEQLARVQAEQDVINQQIEQFGMTEARMAALTANNAAMEASLKALKAQGFEVNIPEAPAATVKENTQFDPNALRNDFNAALIHGFDMNNRYQRLYGQPMPDSLNDLVREATQARKPLPQYVAEKYDFSGREKSQREEAQKKHDDEIRAAAVKEYQEKNPVMAGNPEMQRGVASRFPSVMKPREVGDVRKFAGLTAREKIAQSIARTSQALSSAS